MRMHGRNLLNLLLSAMTAGPLWAAAPGLAPRSQPAWQAVALRGYEFQVLEAGPRGGELVIFLHGFPQFADAWTVYLHRAAQYGFHAVALNQRGYSPGARPAEVSGYAIPELTRDVLALADHYRVNRFHLVAHDWGGILAWQLAADHPDRLRSLTVLSTPHTTSVLEARKSDPDQRQRSQYIDFFRLPEGQAEKGMLADGAKRLRSAYQGKLSDEAVERNVERLSQPGALTAALNWYRALDLDAQVGPSKVSTLFIWGSHDHALGPLAAASTVKRVDAPYRFVVLEGRSHWLLEEATDDIVPLMLDHIAKTR